MANENENETTPETPPELTPAYIAEMTNDSERFDKLPIEEQERIAGAFTDGKVTDEEVDAARTQLGEPPAKTPEEEAAEKAAADEAAAALTGADTKAAEEEEGKTESELLAEARVARRKEYDEKRAELRKTLDIPEPERLTDAHDEWVAARHKALLDMDDLRESYMSQTDKEFIDSNTSLSEKAQATRAEKAVEKAIETSPVFAGKMKLEGGIAAAEKIYNPWLERVTKANGGDPAKPEDVNAAYRRFLSDKTFAANAALETPTNIQQILIALTAKDGVKRGLTPRGALADAAERLGVLSTWEQDHVQGKVNEATSTQTTSIKKVLAAKPSEVRTAPAGAPGPSQIQNDTIPYDKDSAEAYLSKQLDKEDAYARQTGKHYKRTEKEELYANTALGILEKQGA